MSSAVSTPETTETTSAPPVTPTEKQLHRTPRPDYRGPVTETEQRVPADRWRAELRKRLLVARKNRDALRTSVLRSVLSAVDNAETPGGPIPQAGAIADSAAGLGVAEVARRVLTDDEIRLVVRREIDDRLGAAEQLEEGFGSGLLSGLGVCF